MIEPRPHIAFLTTTLDVSGAERVMALLADGLSAHGYRVSVIALKSGAGALRQLIANPDVTVMDLGITGIHTVGGIRRLRHWLTTENVSVLYTFLYHAHVLGRVVGHLSNVPHIISSQQVANWGGPVRQTLDRWTARWCDRVIAVSEGVRQDLVERMKVPAQRVAVIFNAIDVSSYSSRIAPFAHVHDREIVIGSASRLAPEKNHESLIEGFALALAITPRLRLRLAGSGPLAPTLERLIQTKRLSHAVQLLGHVGDMRAFHDSIDLYVQPSRTEGLPCAVIEAMAMSRPVVATDVPGNRDAVEAGVTGWLIEPDSHSAWAAAIDRAVRDPVQATSFGIAGRQRAEQLFGAPQMIADTLQLLRDIGVPSRRDR